MNKKTAVLFFLFCLVFTPLNAETFTFGQTDQVTITPPAGWDIWAVENVDRSRHHTITFVADESRKPGCTLTILAGNRQFTHTEASFLAYTKNEYAKIARQFMERKPAFKKIEVENGFAYYAVVRYRAYFLLPPAKGRAKVCGLVFLYKENSPVVVASLYVDKTKDPALDLMLQTVRTMEMNFPNYKSNYFQFNAQHAVKLDIPEAWQVQMRGANTDSGVGYTLTIEPDNDVRILGLITILAAAAPSVMTREDLLVSLQKEGDLSAADAVEERATVVPVNVKNGYGGYYILTDASLVGKKPPPDEYLIFARFVLQYNNGALAVITILMDDIDCAEFGQFMDAIIAMEPVIAERQ